MLEAMTPIGTPILVPTKLEEDRAAFTLQEREAARDFYEKEGYVVLRGLLPEPVCEAVCRAYETELRPSRTPILRQKNMRYERNSFDEDGFLQNPIFNLQDLDGRSFRQFKPAALNALTHAAVAGITAFLLRRERPTKLIQSMFFEAPAGTWAHQDSYYQDSAAGLGNCIAGWFALEDIDPGAGRFYVCPRSHTALPVLRNSGRLDFAFGHERYKQAVLEAVEQAGLDWHAPFLRRGDVLFWSSLTVHGSLPAARRGVSRRSLTAHYLGEEDAMLQFHSRIRPQQTMTYNGMTVGLLHDQERWSNRRIRDIAWHLPGPYAMARKLAIRAMLRLRGGRGEAEQAPERIAGGMEQTGA